VADLARYVVEAVVLEGRSIRKAAEAFGVSKSWTAELVARYRDDGYVAIEPRSKAPHSNPNRTSSEIEERIVAARKQLADAGWDAGPQTIHYHLSTAGIDPPSITTIWRILQRRGFITPAPKKRPRSSWIRFEADLPNERWQSDFTLWELADGTEVKILNFEDDHSRLLTASRAYRALSTKDVYALLLKAAETWGLPASLLTDNGSVYGSMLTQGLSPFESWLADLGIALIHSRFRHPQTMGKIERLQQTMKVFLDKQPRAATIRGLQTQLDTFRTYYNEIRPHRARNRMTPRAAFDAKQKARPDPSALSAKSHKRILTTRVRDEGVLHLRVDGHPHTIGVGVAYAGMKVRIVVKGKNIRIVTQDGELIRALTLDPSRNYQPSGSRRGGPKIPRKLSGMT
jgi:transposase InsO family protein